MLTDQEFANYFALSRINDSNVKSDPPYLSGTIPGRIYGGLLVSQAANSFTTIHRDLIPHTINYKFVAAGNSNIPIHFKIRSFGTVASIMAYQNEKLVGIGHARYSSEADLLDSSRFLSPDYGSIDAYPSVEELIRRREGRVDATIVALGRFPIDARPIIDNTKIDRTAMWLRIKREYHGSLKPSDGFVVLMFLSDCTMFLAAVEAYKRAGIKITSLASLHHTVWLHDSNLDPHGWYLSITDCEALSHGRALQRSHIFDESRKCVMTVVQEGYLQRAKEGKL